MTLDKSKRYEFAGDVYEWWEGSCWVSNAKPWFNSDFQFLADKGLVKEVRELLVFEGEAGFSADGQWMFGSDPTEWSELPIEDRKGRTFKVTWTEVLP